MGDSRYGMCISFCWLGEYEDCDIEPPRDCELIVAGLEWSTLLSPPERSISLPSCIPKPPDAKSGCNIVVEMPRADICDSMKPVFRVCIPTLLILLTWNGGPGVFCAYRVLDFGAASTRSLLPGELIAPVELCVSWMLIRGLHRAVAFSLG